MQRTRVVIGERATGLPDQRAVGHMAHRHGNEIAGDGGAVRFPLSVASQACGLDAAHPIAAADLGDPFTGAYIDPARHRRIT